MEYPFLPNALQSYIADTSNIDTQLEPYERYLPGSKIILDPDEDVDLDMWVAVNLNIEPGTRPTPGTPRETDYGYNYWLTLQNIKTKEYGSTAKIFVVDDSGKDHMSIYYNVVIQASHWTPIYSKADPEMIIAYQASSVYVPGLEKDSIVDVQFDPMGQWTGNDAGQAALENSEAALAQIICHAVYVGQNNQNNRLNFMCLNSFQPSVDLHFFTLVRSDIRADFQGV